MNLPPIATSPPPHPPETPDSAAITMAKAQELEAAFLAEMLAHAGLGDMEGPFGGGQGEEQFSSFLRQEQARLMVERGGIGLSQQIFEQLKTKEGGNHGTG